MYNFLDYFFVIPERHLISPDHSSSLTSSPARGQLEDSSVEQLCQGEQADAQEDTCRKNSSDGDRQTDWQKLPNQPSMSTRISVNVRFRSRSYSDEMTALSPISQPSYP